MRTTSLALALTILLAGAAAAEPATEKDWAAGPVQHLMTAEDKAQWSALKTEAEKKAFIDLFWARRDPKPATPENELKIEFEMRVALADQHFTTKRTRGALTDRGRALILLGSPLNVGSKGGQARSQSSRGDGTLLSVQGTAPTLTWSYGQDKKPQFIKRKTFELVFVDDQRDGQFQLAKGAKVDPEAILQEAVQFYIFAPDLTAVPGAPVTAGPQTPSSFRTAALKAAYEQFRTAGKASEGPARLTWGQFITPDGDTFVPVSLFVPSGAGLEPGRQVTFFGLVEDADGKVVEVHEETVTLAASRSDAYVDKSLLLQPGTYNATFGLADDAGKVLSMTRTEMTVDKLDPAESAISDLILSNNAFKLPQAQEITDPFAFGGLKVIPKGDGLFTADDEIWYFYELRNPGKDEASGQPKMAVKINIEGKTAQDKPVSMNFPIQEFPTFELKGVTNHFGLPLTFSAKDFKPGKYTVKIKVIDTVLKKTYQSEKQFEIKG